MKETNNVMPKTFFWMFLGLLGTAIVSWYTYSSGLFLEIFEKNFFGILLIIELVVVIAFSLLFHKLPPTIVAILYFAYSMINGVTISTIFAAFELNSIITVFTVSALAFGGLALYGYITKNNFSSWGPILTWGLIAGFIVTLINIFLKNSMLDLILDWFILILFFGMTIYDMNQLKMLQYQEGLDHNKIHIYAAMQLYLDFINIFLRVLSIFGNKKE